MRAILVAILAMAVLTVGFGVRGQVPSGQPVTPPQAKINLTVEQRHTIKELVKDLHLPKVSGDFPTEIGDTVPKTVVLQPMPSEIASKVPQVKSHVFFLMDDRVVLVSPKDNKVAEVID